MANPTINITSRVATDTLTFTSVVAAQGPAGPGVPTGGTTGQILSKNSNSDYDTSWTAAGAGSGDVVGPASATDNAVARFDTATGKLIQNSGVTVDDSGNIATTGTVDGRDVSVDGTKLDGIEAGATADQSDAEIKTAYENNANTNAFTDAEQTKLSGIETSADVTDAVNVSAAGAPIISSGAGVPGSTPSKVGDVYIDTTNDNAYIATGTASSADWEISNDGAGGGITDGDKGDITVSGGGTTWTVDNDVVTYAKMQNISANNRILGNDNGANQDPQELSPEDVRTIINVEDGADVTDATNVSAAGAPIISSGAGAPSSTPSKVGDIYVDTTNDLVYVATDTASSADWDQVVDNDATQTLTNKTIDGDNNTISNLDLGNEVDWAAIGDITDRTAFASGDKIPIFEAGVGFRKVDYDDLPGAGGGLSNIVEDGTPQLGGQLDVNGQAIGDGTNELLTFVEDASAVNHVEIENEATGSGPIIRATGDNANVELNLDTKGTADVNVLDNLDVTGNITLTGTVDGRDVAADGTKLDGVESSADVTDATNVSAAGAPIISSGAGAPASTPSKVGDIYIDTTANNAYIATGTASSGDWEISNDGAGVSDGDKGDITVTASGATWTIDNDAVTYAKIQDISVNNRILGNVSGSAQPVAELGAVDVRTMINVENGADVTDATNVSAAGAPIISSGAGVPGSTPSKVGDIYIDTTNDNAYIATGTASSADWEISNDGAGGGDVSKVGTPVDNQVGVWTGDGTIEGDTALTFDTSTDTLSIGASGNLNFGAVTVIDDASGTTTLQNIDAIDATTETTLEAAIDSLSNLTTVGTVTTGNVDAVVSAASGTTAGKVELATVGEIDTGTDNTRAITPDGLAGSDFGLKYVQLTCFDYTTDTAVGDGAAYLHIPAGLDGFDLVEVHAEVITAGTTGTTDVQIHNVDNALDMLSTKLTIDSAETGSDTAATAAVINTSNDHVNTNDVVRIDVDAVSTTAAKGLLVTLGFRKP